VAAWEDSSTGDEENTRCVKAAVRVEVAAPLDGRTCTTIAEPEPIAGPTPDPDSSAPELRIAGRKTVKLGRSMAVLASCDEACALVAGGTLSTKRPRRKAKRVKASAKFRLKGTRTKLTPARRRQRLTLKLSRRSYLKVRRALRRGYRASVAVKIVARDGRGNTKAFRRTLLVKRKR
jgi:hypothetical protein